MNDRLKFRCVYDNEVCDVVTPFDHDVMLQCTGLRDKNGTLIYEGDIIEKHGKRGRYVVNWNPRGFWSVGSYVAFSSVCNLLKTHYEVIGNIYENPELLEAENENS